MSRKEDIDNAMWTRPFFLDLPPDGKLFYIWSWTNDHANLAGLYELPALAVVRLETGFTGRRLETALTAVKGAGAVRIEEPLIWVADRVTRLSSQNPSVVRAIKKDLARVNETHPNHRLFEAWGQCYRDLQWLKKDPLTERDLDRLPTGCQQPWGSGTGSGSGLHTVENAQVTPFPSRSQDYSRENESA